MLTSLLRFEWRYHTRQASFAAASLFFLLFGFALTASRFGPNNVTVNSSWLVMESTGLLSLLSLFAVAIFASHAVLRDVEHGMLEIVYTTPVGRFHYLFGRFAGAALATLTVTAMSVVGMLAATFMPWIEPERVGAFNLLPYVWSFLVLMLPNVLFATALLFAIAALTRSAVATYVGAVFTYVIYLAVAALTNSPLMAQSKPGVTSGGLVALLDPFGLSSFFDVTRYWSIAEKNSRFVALTGSLLTNRLLWLAITAAIFAFVYVTFSFRVLRKSRRRQRAGGATGVSPVVESTSGTPVTPQVHPLWLSSYLSVVRLESRMLLWNLPFLLVLLLWMALAGSELRADILESEFRTALYPTTALIIASLQQPLGLLGTILLVYFSAEVFWREQRDRMTSIINTTPVPGSVMIAAKWSALAAMIASIIVSGIAAGIVLQLLSGYTRFEPLLYLSLFWFAGFPLLLLAAAAILIHSISPGKYAGMVFVLLFVVFIRITGAIGLQHSLWRFGSGPPVTYTDLDGFGPNATPFAWLMLHWALIAALFLVVATMRWRKTARQRSLAITLTLLSLASGGWIFFNTNIRNDYFTASELTDWRVAYEKQYRKLAAMPQPAVTDIDLALDFYPRERRYHVAAVERIVNPTTTPIRTIWIAVRREAEIRRIAIAGARLAQKDARFGMHRFELDPPLAPGARTEFRYDLDFGRRGFEDGEQDDPILASGTFLIGFRLFPTFGYRAGYELADPRERSKRGLPPRETAAPSPSPRVNLTATLSTSNDQTAISLGTLERAWQQNGRRYFRYRTDAPISNDAAFGTGRYAIAKRRARNVDVELYYDPAHSQNVDRMLTAAVTSLDTFENAFGPYPHRQLRMAEVVRQDFGGYASPGMLWFVDTRAMLTDARDPGRPDIVTRRVVHEVAHQWWGHQLRPAPGPGASLLVETLAKHSESMIIERLRGRDHLDRFLEMETDRYLAGRSREDDTEAPLLRVDSQAYVYYAKGAVVMNGIAREIGEASLNTALRELLRQPNPTADDLLTQLRGNPLIEEWLKEIVLYDFRLDSATAHRRPDGRYDVTLRITATKNHADARGNEHAVPFSESIEIAPFDKHLLHEGTQELTLTVDQVPDSVTIDPHVTRVDRNRNDNVGAVDRT